MNYDNVRVRLHPVILGCSISRLAVFPSTPPYRSLDNGSVIVERVLMRIPVPNVYGTEQADGSVVYSVGDPGVNFFLVMRAFRDNQFPLSNLLDPTFEGKFYRDLPVRFQNRIDDTVFTLCIIQWEKDGQNPDDILEVVRQTEGDDAHAIDSV